MPRLPLLDRLERPLLRDGEEERVDERTALPERPPEGALRTAPLLRELPRDGALRTVPPCDLLRDGALRTPPWELLRDGVLLTFPPRALSLLPLRTLLPERERVELSPLTVRLGGVYSELRGGIYPVWPGRV